MYTIQKHLEYNIWANGKIAEILSNVDESLFDKEIVSSFPSLRKTVLHIWDAEQLWHSRLRGEVPTGWPSSNFKGNTKDLLEGYKSESVNLAGFIKSKDRNFIESSFTYKNTKGVEYTNKVEDMLFHVVNHGTFHRGQLITMLRQLGFQQFPSQDLIAFAREN